MANVTVQEAIQVGLQHHQAGRLAQAEAIYQQILKAAPDHPDALHLMGLLALNAGRRDVALDYVRRAVAQRGDVADYRNSLGLLLLLDHKRDEGIAELQIAIRLNPNLPEAHNNLGLAMTELGRIDEAIAAHQRALQIKPGFFEAQFALANLYYGKGQFADAAAGFRAAIQLQPQNHEPMNSLGVALQQAGDREAALAEYRRALSIKPDAPHVLNNLGNLLTHMQRFDEAISALRQAIQLKPDYAAAYQNLGTALYRKRELPESIAAYRRAIELNPASAEARNNLGNAFVADGDLDRAAESYRGAIAIDPNYGDAVDNLASVLKDEGDLDAAIATYRQAMELRPEHSKYFSDYLLTLYYHPDSTAAGIYAEHRRWNALFVEPVKHLIRPHANDRDPNRRLRIGYLSADFFAHAVSRFFLPLLSHHDRSAVEVCCYADVAVPDPITARIRAAADLWRDTAGWSSERIIEQIRADRIDILVDLAAHTTRNRLALFGQRPAPVQVTWLAYNGTTGVDGIDYRITDPYLDPPDHPQDFYSEQSVRLPETYWCYGAPDDPQPVVPLPARSAGHFTFGCLNSFFKVNKPLLELWVRILSATQNSRLVLYAARGSHRQRVVDQFAAASIDLSRLRFIDRVRINDYFATYSTIDVALDTFPYNGGTTTCDALWMGVPVVSRVGQTPVSREGFSLLSNIGMPELVAQSAEDYVRIAIELAGDLPRLEQLRSGLRLRMLESPLMDAPRFARNMEAAYRQMWRNWCGESGKENVKRTT